MHPERGEGELQANSCLSLCVNIGIYQATKAALIQASEVLRLEMAPLGVRVLTLLTGGVATNFLANLPTLALPESSYYLGIKDIIEKKPEQISFGVSPEAFAHDVLCQVEKGTTGKFWIGDGAGIARLALWLLPQWAIVTIPSTQDALGLSDIY